MGPRRFGTENLEHLVEECRRYRAEKKFEADEIAGVKNDRLDSIIAGQEIPTIDELLSLADYFYVSLNFIAGIASSRREEASRYPTWMLEAVFCRTSGRSYTLTDIAREAAKDVAAIKYNLAWPENLIVEINHGTLLDFPMTPEREHDIEMALESLPERSREMILAHYKKKIPIVVIAETFEITRSRAYQIIRRAIVKLRHPRIFRRIMFGSEYVEAECELTRQAKVLEEKRKYLLSVSQRLEGLEKELQASEELFCSKKKPKIEELQDLSRADLCEWYSTPLSELGLSTRAFNALSRSRCYVLGDIIAMARDKSILKISRIGKKTRTEIINMLEERTDITFHSLRMEI